MEKILKAIYKHLLGWLVVFFILYLTTLSDKSNTIEKIGFILTFLSFQAFIHYQNYFALKHYFEKSQIKKYVVFIIIVLIVNPFFVYYLSRLFDIKGFKQSFIQDVINTFATYIFSSAVYFIRIGFINQLKKKEAKNIQLEAEMQMLRMQIQPHFLFNTLNNIYAINLSNHEKANEIILQLADILRFQLDVSKKQFISLKEEIELLENYIALEKIRLYECAVVVEKTGYFDSFQITPLLLLPLVENAFKYGKDSIFIKFEIQDNVFTFVCENEISAKALQKKSAKTGVENVRKRLALIYPDKYSFSADKKEEKFYVNLQLNL